MLLYPLTFLLGQVAAETYYVSTSMGKSMANGTQPQYASSNLTNILARSSDKSRILLCRGDVFIGPFVSEKSVTFGTYVCNTNRTTAPTITSSIPVGSPTLQKGPNGKTIWVYDVSSIMKPDQLMGNVFVDGQQYVVARWPNLVDPKVRIGTSKTEFQFMKKQSKNSFIFSDETLKKGTTYWVGATVRYRPMSWGNDRRIIGGYNPSNQSHITTLPTHFPPWYFQDSFGYYLENIFGELDAPGEYYYDRKTLKLYLIPIDGANPKKFSRMNTDYGTWILPTSNKTSLKFLYEGYDDACLTIKGNSTSLSGIAVTKCMNGIMSLAEKTSIVGASVSSTIHAGIRMNTGVVANGTVRSSMVYGIYGGSEISHMRVSDITMTAGYSAAPGTKYSNGIWCQNCTVHHCVVHTTGHIGVYPDDFAVIRDNVFDRNMLGFGDGGSIYGFRRKNVTVMNNYFGDVPGNFISAQLRDQPNGYGPLVSVYADAASSGWKIKGNIMKPGDNMRRCVYSSNGRYHDVVGNLCIGAAIETTAGDSLTSDFLRLENNTFAPAKGTDGRQIQWSFWNITDSDQISFKGNRFIRKTSDKKWSPIELNVRPFKVDLKKNIVDRSGQFPEQGAVDRLMECARITKSYGFHPTPYWKTQSCVSQFCRSLNSTIAARPDNQPAKAAYERECVPPKTYNDGECAQVHEKYGVIPHITWGSTPNNMKPIWDKSGCNEKMCQYWVGKYKVRSASDTKAIPSNIKPSWDHMKCASRVKFYR